MRAGIAAVAILAAGLPVASLAAPEAGSRPTREFVQAAGESDAFEMMAAVTALAESKDAQVRAFAQHMLSDHGRTSRALTAAATGAGLAPPTTQVGAAQSSWLGALESARGDDFDRLYWRQQALAHRAALVTAQQYAATGDTLAIRQAAAAAVPIIAAHLAMAERMTATASPDH